MNGRANLKMLILAAGNSPHSKRWVEYFADRGHAVYWVSMVPFTERLNGKVEMYCLGRDSASLVKSVNIILGMKKVKRLAESIRPDLVHVHYAGIYGLLGLATRVRPMIVTAWGSDVLIAGRSLIKRPFVLRTLRSADLVTCDAEHMRVAIKEMGIEHSKVRIIYFGTDTTKFKPHTKSEALQRQFGLHNRPTVISMRNLEPIYDVASLVRAVPHVLRHVPNVVFVIGSTGSEVHSLKTLAHTLGVTENIKFVGTIPNLALSEYFNTADVYVSTSLSDAGLSASAAEAMACGCPVVMTDSGENRFWVKQGEGGFVVPVKDPIALSTRIIYLLQNPSEARKFGSFNRRVILERNNYHVEMAKMEELYLEVVRGYEKGVSRF